jgi:glycosyltransferase involved in cell wall biosynthesis
MSDISVLMSVYKSEKAAYLDRALTSVWDDQTLKPEKIVLIQDGPVGEELAQIVNQWEKKLGEKLEVIRNEQNIGLTKSLIKGISVIKTDYIARMDSDDISLPERFTRQAEFLDSHPEISIVGSDIIEFSDTAGELGIRKYPRNTDDAIKTIYKANPLAHPAVMMRKSMFDAGVNYNADYRTTQDLALWFDVLSAGYKIHNIDTPLLKFRRDDAIYHRRSNMKDSWLELKIHERGIYKLYGLSPIKSLFPLARFALRLLPGFMIKAVYNGKLRKKIVE